MPSDGSTPAPSENNKIYNAWDFCFQLLEEKAIASVPGRSFGAENNIRFSYAISSELIKFGGKLILEIAYNQKQEVKQLLRKNGFYINSVDKDLAKNDRCIISTKIK